MKALLQSFWGQFHFSQHAASLFSRTLAACLRKTALQNIKRAPINTIDTGSITLGAAFPNTSTRASARRGCGWIGCLANMESRRTQQLGAATFARPWKHGACANRPRKPPGHRPRRTPGFRGTESPRLDRTRPAASSEGPPGQGPDRGAAACGNALHDFLPVR
jgi:hypothetical protein